ncbi:MAG: hypothetical protein QN178_00500 [Armatimonadota bacterium]|nr:hypothetical protein [Armatimonadota bacterium]
MGRFQIMILCLLAAIVVELAVIAMRLPLLSAQAQETRRPIPVIIADAGPQSVDCPPAVTCARVESGGVLRVTVSR